MNKRKKRSGVRFPAWSIKNRFIYNLLYSPKKKDNRNKSNINGPLLLPGGSDFLLKITLITPSQSVYMSL
jgi:hypothetical protein